VERRRCDLSLARAAFERALDADLGNAEARAGLAEVALYEGRPDEAMAQAEHGLASAEGRRAASLWRVRALALLELGAYDLGRDSAALALALAPQDARVVEAYARAAFRTGDMETAREAYQRAVILDPDAEEANLRLGSGFGAAGDQRPWTEAPLDVLWRRALAAWDAGDLESAGFDFRTLCARAPDTYKFHLGLGLVRAAQRRRGEVRYGGDAAAAYLLLPGKDAAALERLAPGYGALTPLEQHVVRVSVAPASRWWDLLLASGASHAILSLSESLADAADRRHLVGNVTFDGRHYEHLRGVGGKHAATGAEKLRQAADFGFNTFAHEFAHQVMRFAFPAELVEEIDRLYEQAMEEGTALDWYAASNADEYFAQGYEAFVSHVKRGCLKETQRHTRRELKRRDPRLYAFLTEHLDLTHEADGALEAFWSHLAPR
ncbi:MAG: tetratricopeptide repeat protein, partial [Planctomycetota bacterium]